MPPKKKSVKKSSSDNKCVKRVQKKIRKNMREYNKSKKVIKNRGMAIAMAYSDVKRKYPQCRPHLKKKKKSTVKKRKK